MELYIQIRNGQPYEHPIFGDNLREAFPDIDTNNLPDTFAPFVRHDPSGIAVGPYEMLVEEYVWNGAVVEDNWHTRPMTDEEAAAKRAEGVEQTEAARANMISWGTDQLNAAADADKPVWQAYINDIAAVTYADPFSIVWPMPPRKDKNGNWLTTAAPGSTPNVVG